jgi:hypothetical protein
VSLASRLTDLVAAIGADIKQLLVTRDAPSYLPSSALHNWQAETSSYNFKDSNQHVVRGGVAKLLQGTADLDIVAVMDSTGIGYNGSAYKFTNSLAYQFGKVFAAMLGVPFGGGMEMCVSDGTHATDRWVLTGAAVPGSSYIISSGAGTAEWTSPDEGTQIDLVYSNLQTNGLTWTIDGVAQTPLVTDGTSTMRKVTVTGLAAGFHKVKVTSLAGKTMLLYEIGSRNPGVKSLYIHCLTVGGSRANSGTNDQNWSSTASTIPAGLGFTLVGGFNLLGYTPALVICCLGNNDVYQGQTVANILTGITAVRNYWPSAAFSFAHPPMIPGTNATTFAAFCTAIFGLMDTLDASFLDWNDLVGTTTGFVADGQAGADGVHPIWGHAMMVARTWAKLFVRSPVPPTTLITPDGDPGTPPWKIMLSTALATTWANLRETYVGANLISWDNEWGALRGTSPYTTGDALVRAMRQTWDGITNRASAIELVDRRTAGQSNTMWGIGWDGVQRIGGTSTNPAGTDTVHAVLVAHGAAAPSGLPDGTLIFERTS